MKIEENNILTIDEKLANAFALQDSDKVRKLIKEGARKEVLRECAKRIGGWHLTMLQCDLLEEFEL